MVAKAYRSPVASFSELNLQGVTRLDHQANIYWLREVWYIRYVKKDPNILLALFCKALKNKHTLPAFKAHRDPWPHLTFTLTLWLREDGKGLLRLKEAWSLHKGTKSLNTECSVSKWHTPLSSWVPLGQLRPQQHLASALCDNRSLLFLNTFSLCKRYSVW